jgi:hypothetical protein
LPVKKHMNLNQDTKAVPGKGVTPVEDPREWQIRYCYYTMAVACFLSFLLEATAGM